MKRARLANIIAILSIFICSSLIFLAKGIKDNYVKEENVRKIAENNFVRNSASLSLENNDAVKLGLKAYTDKNATYKVYQSPQPDSDESIKNNNIEPKQPKLHIESFISKINDKEIKETTPEVKIENSNTQTEASSDSQTEENSNTQAQEGSNTQTEESSDTQTEENSDTQNIKITYKKQKLKEKIRYGDNIEITIRIYNEGEGAGYAQKITNIIPKGIEFIKNDETNKDNEWKQTKNNTVETEILKKKPEIENQTTTSTEESETEDLTTTSTEESETESQTTTPTEEPEDENLIKAPTEEKVDYREVKLALKITEKGLVEEALKNITKVESADIGIQEISVPFVYYDAATKTQKTEVKTIQIPRDELQGNLTPPTINETQIEIGGKKITVTPKGWAKTLDGSSGVEIENGQDISVEKTDNGQTYYMIYVYKAKVKVPDESGNMQEKEIEIQIGSDGQRQESSEGGADKNKKLELAEHPINPKGEPDTEEDEWKLEGYVKKGKEEEYPEKETQTIEPETEIPEDGNEYYTKFVKKVTVSRYIHPDNTKLESDLTGEAVAIEEKIYPAEINLGTADNITTVDGDIAEPYKWITDISIIQEGTTAEQINGIDPEGTIELTEDEEYYMVYKVRGEDVYVGARDQMTAKKKHIVRYDYTSNGGSNWNGGETTVKVRGDEAVKLDWTATKEGWKFEGWSQTQNSHETEEQITMGENDITLYAIFSKELEASFNSGNSTPQEKKTRNIYNNETQININAPAITNVQKNNKVYEGKGWSTNPEKTATIEVEPQGEITLKDGVESPSYYAIYGIQGGQGETRDQVNMVFKYWDGEKVSEETVQVRDRTNYKGEPIDQDIVIEVPRAVQESIGSLETIYQGVSKEEKGESIAPNLTNGLTYYAIYSKEVTLTKHVYNSKEEVSSTETKTVYGYYNGQTKNPTVNLGTADNITTVDGDIAEPYKWVTDISIIQEGTTAEQINGIDPEGTIELTEDAEYYMVYKVQGEEVYVGANNQMTAKPKHTVRYDYTSNGGANWNGGETTVRVRGDEAVKLDWTATKEGWKFEGWSQTQNSHETEEQITMGENDITLYAIFSKELEASFNSGNSNPQEKITRNIYNNETQININAPAITNVQKNNKVYEGKGWSTNSEKTATIEVEPQGEITLKDGVESPSYYAIYGIQGGQGETRDQVNMVFKYWNGEEVAEETVQVRDRTNYKGEPIDQDTEIEVPRAVQESIGSLETIYKGVSKEEKGEGITPNLTNGLTYYAIYSKEVTLTKYVHNSKEAAGSPETKTVYGYYNGQTKNPTVNLGTGQNVGEYTPLGWSTKNEVTSTPEISINGDIEITANTTYYLNYEKQVTVTFDKNEGENEPSPEVSKTYLGYSDDKIPAKIKIPEEEPSRFNYTFLGYSENKKEENATYLKGQTYDFYNSTTIYAIWKIIDDASPVIEFETNGSTEWSKEHKTRIIVTDQTLDESSLKYIWSQDTTTPNEEEFNKQEAVSFSNREEISKNGLTGNNWHLWVLAKDEVGHHTIEKSEDFYFDNILPEADKPTLEPKLSSITATFKQTDKDSLIDESTKQYAIKETSAGEDAWQWATDAQATHKFEGLKLGTSYIVKTKVQDNAGNEQESETETISTLNLTKPTITLSEYEWTNKPVKVTIDYPEVEDEVTYQYSYNANFEPFEIYDQPFDVEENKTIYARTLGANGEGADIVSEQAISKIDTTHPVIQEESNIGTEVTEESGKVGVKVSINAQDEQSGIKYYQFSQEADLNAESLGWTESNSPNVVIKDYTEFITNPGTWYLYVKDQAENVSNKRFEISESSFDNIAPQIEYTPKDTWVKDSVEVVITYPTFTGLIKEYKNGTAGLTTSSSNTVSLTVDERGTVIEAKSTLGSNVRTANLTVNYIDKVEPDIKELIETSVTQDSIILNVDAEDTLSGLAKENTYTYFLDGVQQGTPTTEPSYYFSNLENEHQYTVGVKVQDDVGNTTEIKTKQIKTLKSIYDPETWGDYYDIQYSAGGVNEWKIFYANAGYIYLITSDYLNNSLLPEDSGMAAATANNTEDERFYCTYFPTIPTTKISDIKKFNTSEIIKRHFMKFTNTSGTQSALMYTAKLLDPDIWQKFVNSNIADEAIGTPTLELFCESWNKRHPELTQITPTIYDGSYSINNGNNISIGTSDSLYTITSQQHGKYNIFASPGILTSNEKNLCCVTSEGIVTRDAIGHTKIEGSCAIRPIVRLQTNVKVSKRADGSYRLIKEIDPSDQKPPTINSISTKDQKIASITVTVDAQDGETGIPDAGGYAWYIDGRFMATTDTNTYTYTNVSRGTGVKHTFTVEVSDKAGNISSKTTDEIPFTYKANEVIKPENIGDKVKNYTVTPKSGYEIKDWQIYYRDDDYVYLISSNYIPFALIPPETGCVNHTNDYSFYWPEPPSKTINQIAKFNSSQIINRYYTQLTNLAETNVNFKYTASLINPDYWESFVNQQYADEAIGGPPLELLQASWRAKNEQGVPEESSAFKLTGTDKGYSLNNGQTALEIGSGALGEPNSIYALTDTDRCTAYILPSPMYSTSSVNDTGYAVASIDGMLGTLNVNATPSRPNTKRGLRPIVRLNIDTKLEYSDGGWNLSR